MSRPSPKGGHEAGLFISAEPGRTTNVEPSRIRSGGPHRTIGLFSTHVPRELFYALGCRPVRVFPTAGKPTASEAYLPRNFCALTRLILASFLDDEPADLDAVIFADEDDAMRRLHDVWRACVSVPVWGFVEVPRAATSLAVSRYVEVLLATAADLEARTTQSLNVESLRQAIDVYNAQRHLLADLKRHWLTRRMNTIAYRRLRRLALTREPAAVHERLRQTLAGIEKGAESSPAPSPARRLLLLAELAAPGGLVRLVEANGARVVAEDSDLDERDITEPIPALAETVEGLLTALAQAYLSRPSPRMRDLPSRLAHITRLVTERRVQAAICAYGKFCDLYLAEVPILMAHLEGLGVPVLLLELEDETISGQHRTRVEAFLEMIR